MAVTAPPAGAGAGADALGRVDRSTSTRSEDAITLAIIAWLIAGLFIDGYAHANIIDTATEDFFTPWHGIFYAAFATLTGWIGWIGYQRRRPGPILDWFPAGYRAAVVGLVIFAIGGVGDGIWHTVFGVEVGIDALLSPTHLILFVGALLLLWTPIRAATARGDRAAWIGMGTAALMTAFLVFFVQYMWLLPQTWLAGVPFSPESGANWEYLTLFLAATPVQAAVLTGPLVLIARRWRLPFGTATGIWVTAAVLEMAAFSAEVVAVLAVIAGGLAFDLCYRFVGSSGMRLAVAAFAGPAVTFAAYLAIAASEQPLGWPPEIWGGVIMIAGFTGAAVVLLQESGQLEPITAGP
ncbi:MAG: hypothetical protein AAF467_19630 [Actinomycetota bacterium]